MDKTCMSYWFPKIESAGLRVPKTIFVEMSQAAQRDVFKLFDGKEITGDAKPFFDQIEYAGASLGYPCFLRTGHTSGKHDWERTCFLTHPSDIVAHVTAIIEYGECTSMIGLPFDVWAVREYLPVIPLGICTKFGNMPICREWRYFVNDGSIICKHPYWPLDALAQGGYEPAISLDDLVLVKDRAELDALAIRAGAAVGGYWSVDILETKTGWYVTDMAEGEKSFHWKGCELAL